MDLAGHVRAVEVLMSPLQWGSQESWLAESVERVRLARGVHGSRTPATALGELQELLRLHGDETGWLEAALDSVGTRSGGRACPSVAAVPDDLLPVVSLRCALAAGLATLHRLHEWRAALGQAFDDVDTGMAIFRSDGLEVTRNARWDELLAEEPERGRLLELATRQAAETTAWMGELRLDEGEVELSGRSYRLVASRSTAGTLLPDAAVLVLMNRMSPGLPTTQELRVSFGLRGREPQVALLAAEGLSNADIAQRLRLSAHTVRHYLERVLDRLGLHSRKALALHLIAPPAPSSPPPSSAPRSARSAPSASSP
jgi:DNA-binding NarL/FixJ family response regulator